MQINTRQQQLTVQLGSCPDWADGIGRDRYGLFVEVKVAGTSFILRWIPPGSFMLGSPDDEVGRDDDEGPQQRITFSQGYWLAETACSQALWQAVMGENKSRFKGEDRPVDKVSWQQTQDFIVALNIQKPGLDCYLPSEAAWEYACRAGSQTPFWFGSELTTEQANYDGNNPYADGKKGVYRETTVPVKEFRPNPWGLYQMHGNVWEWCEDYWHNTHEDADPNGRARGKGDSDNHVCRGGSWIHYGGYLRSACRHDWLSGYASTGFRLARGPQASQS